MSESDIPQQILPTAAEEASARYKFLVLFAEPFRVLEESGEGHGAFAALSIGLFLCERYFRGKSDSLDAWREEKFLEAAARHFGTELDLFREFWGIYRHGMLYQGAPRATEECGWGLGEGDSQAPVKAAEKGKMVIRLNPWGFAAEMIVLCWGDTEVLVRIFDFSLGSTSAFAPGWGFRAEG